MPAAIGFGDLGLDEHADQIVGRLLAAGGDDRRETSDHLRSGSTATARMSRASATGTPKLPVIVSTGIAAQKSTLSSARPSARNESISASTVSLIQFVIHHWALAGTKDGWTSDAVAAMLGAAHHQHGCTRDRRRRRSRPRRSATRRTAASLRYARVAGLVAEGREVRALREREAVNIGSPSTPVSRAPFPGAPVAAPAARAKPGTDHRCTYRRR